MLSPAPPQISTPAAVCGSDLADWDSGTFTEEWRAAATVDRREREREREKGGISSFAVVEARRHASCRVQTCFFTPVNCQDARWEPHYYAPTDNLPHLTPPPPGSSPWWSYRTSDLPRYPGLVWLGDTMTLCNVIMIGPCHWLREGMAPHGWVVLGDTMTGTSTTVNR